MRDPQLTSVHAAKQGIRKILIYATRSQSPAFGGLSFGSVGQYEKLRGTAYGEIDPGDRRNAVITDIELAPVNDRGMVEYSMDIFIIKPINLGAGNHRILYDFNNRGQMRMGFLNNAIPTIMQSPPTTQPPLRMPVWDSSWNWDTPWYRTAGTEGLLASTR